MTFHFPQKLRLTSWVTLFALAVIMFSPMAVHATATDDIQEPSAAEISIDNLNREIVDLSQSLSQASGDERDALQLQLFQKNEELRSQLASAIERETISRDKLILLVKKQEQYSEDATNYLSEKIKKVVEDLNKAKDEEKLALVNDYRELQRYLDVSFDSSWQNLAWLKELGAQNERAEAELKDKIDKRMRLLSASIEYLSQQSEIIGSQLSSSPESEKASLQLSQLITKQRLNIATESLRNLISIGDKVGLETSEYKRQIFEVTGNITHDLLNTKVVWSILSHWSNSALDWFAENAPQHIFQLFVFALILLIARGLAKLTRKVVRKAVASKNLKLSHLMQDFFISMSGKFVWVIGIMVGLSQLGLNLAPILTGFGIAGVIIGFALQDTLSNFAAGMMLLIYRPFDVGDFVYAGGVDGKVSHMSLVNTTIRTFDNQIIIVPNSKIWGDVIKNVTHERIRRVDMVFGIGYADDLLKAESVLSDIITSHPSVLRTPEPMIKVHTLNTSSVDFIVRPWVKTDDYWDVYWDVTKEVKLRFDREGISIPFPQQDVHLHMVEKQDA
ncbi:mechanosensitive ion channel [Vibrio alginolyticus]|jgi:small conductance mechanosensitive channel|uniref:Small-conductance mechanosensitive channel n=6 Tax=Vibrio harveyi group TaxID=717610 RepID=A0A0P7EZJ3_VIBAL|nr:MULTISPECIES: mechanosensitive ion channel family protein [Vibrio]MDW1809065.1 mechanosensitive ion channel [Vibrio sp. Vb2362]MDW1971462.1 mechanosensitive ion channel [Vibrio sp. 945]MDW2259191.1 mechanosensitive ion channel [Vibrio sp. 1409]NAW52402.1 mechanosensitive ion channel [Vibrio sp. V41_P2S12T139]QCO86716.1 mechanosensitive ion channel protein MscS [Vibrio neocaledonicus]QIR89177.1 mechanosensitive ion channel [Vibrio diabolicus]